MIQSRKWSWVWLVLLAPIVAMSETLRNPSEHFFHQSFGDLQEELSLARNENKKGILIMFETDDCPWCKKMKATVFNRATIQDYFRANFRILTVDTEGDTLITDFSGTEIVEKDFALKYNRVRATPVFAFFDLEGELMMRYTGATRDADEFRWLGEFVVEDHYRSNKFTKFKRDKRAGVNNNS